MSIPTISYIGPYLNTVTVTVDFLVFRLNAIHGIDITVDNEGKKRIPFTRMN